MTYTDLLADCDAYRAKVTVNALTGDITTLIYTCSACASSKKLVEKTGNTWVCIDQAKFIEHCNLYSIVAGPPLAITCNTCDDGMS